MPKLVQYFLDYRDGYPFQGLKDIRLIIEHYLWAYGGLIGFMVFISLMVKKENLWKTLTLKEKAFLFFSLSPVVIHHCVQIPATAGHDFRVVKTGVFLITIITIFLNHLLDNQTRKLWIKSLAFLLLAISLVGPFSIYQSHYTYCYQPYRFETLSRQIHQEINSNDVIFVVVPDKLEGIIEPPLLYPAQRNMVQIKMMLEAHQWLKNHPAKQGVVFVLDKKLTITEKQRIAQ